MTYDKEEWKRKKIESGEWLPFGEWKQKKIESGEWNNGKRKREEVEELKEVEEKIDLKDHEIITKKIKVELENKREIIFDTETTGLGKEDKIIEISLMEVVNGVKTGKFFQSYFNPLIKIDEGAYKIHKISNEDVKDSPLFVDKVEEMIEFVGNSLLVAHNAKFDMRFFNSELKNAGWEPYASERFICTCKIARYLFPGEKNKLDNLCERFEVENHDRLVNNKHSAYEDTKILYDVYIKMLELLKLQNLSSYDFKLI